MQKYLQLLSELKLAPKKWLVTGVAGFIGSNILESLLMHDQVVVGLDNFSTGKRENIDEVQSTVSPEQWSRFRLIEGDIRTFSHCEDACAGVDYVLHQAALGSVPRSIDDPISSNSVNVDGFLNMLVAAKAAQVSSFVYAASSSTYGDHPGLPKVESVIGKPLSPYAVTKYVNELYAEVFARTYGFECVGLRYFNVFGKRQDPNGAYAAVIPRWISAMIKNQEVFINGDGLTSRDFCFVENVVQANILAASTHSARNNIFNVAVGGRTTLNDLAKMLSDILRENGVVYEQRIRNRDFRDGDVRHSQADISKAKRLLGYEPHYELQDGLRSAMPWYVKSLANS